MNKRTRKSYTVGDIARICQVTPTTVYRWTVEGKLASFKTAGGHNRIMEEDALTLFKSLEIPSSRIIEENKSSLKVLIVDDDAAIRRLIHRVLLQTFPEISIGEAVDGYEAGFKTAETKPDVVILDLVLPGVDGIKICEMIRDNKNLKRTRILAMTGARSEKAKKALLNAGADGFLQKPFTNEELLRHVKTLLTR